MIEVSDNSKAPSLLQRVLLNRSGLAVAVLILITLVSLTLLFVSPPDSSRSNGDPEVPEISSNADESRVDGDATASLPLLNARSLAARVFDEQRKPSIPTEPPDSKGGAISPPDRAEHGGMDVIESDVEETRLTFSIGEYSLEQVQVNGKKVTLVDYPATQGRLKKRGLPELPTVRSNVMIPAGTTPQLTIVDSKFRDVRCAKLLPSTGFMSRDSARSPPRSDAPGKAVWSGAAYPESPVRLTEPFQIRQVHGVGVIVYPFQFFPERQVLRVYENIDIEVRSLQGARKHTTGRLQVDFRSRDFQHGAQSFFVNYEEAMRSDSDDGTGGVSSEGTTNFRGFTTLETGKLLIVIPEQWTGSISEFVEWKRQRGLSVVVADYPGETGSGATLLADYIQARYEQDAISHVILVGDHTDIPVFQMSPHPTDIMYTLVAGEDSYQDLFISRISATSSTEALNQLSKIVAYEKTPMPSASDGWYAKAAFIGSDEGAATSAFMLDDWEILDNERQKLLGYGYSTVDQIYDPGATATEVVNAWNAGRGLVYYLGHGTETSWNTTGFGVQHINSLANGSKLSFVINGNCKNGNFTRDYGDCLAEAMLKAGTVANPAGGIGVTASTTSMDWDPPIVMMRAFTDYVTSSETLSLGGMTFFSIQAAMDYCYATPDEGTTAAEKIMQQTHLLGDSTLGLRTRLPVALEVSHPAYAASGEMFDVNVTTAGGTLFEGATVCLYRSPDMQITGITDAEGNVSLAPGLIEGDPLTLTVYHPNAVPYQTQIEAAGGTLKIYSNAELPTGFVGEQYTFNHVAVGGTPPYQWTIAGDKPAWLTLDPDTGAVSGIPTTPETVTYVIRITDDEATVDEQEVSFVVGNPVDIKTASLPAAMVGETYETALDATGSFIPFSYRVSAGALPPGVSMSGNGAFRGVPTIAGDYAFTVTASDAEGRTDAEEFVMSVEPSPQITILTSPSLPDAYRNTTYSMTFAAEGGSGSGYAWSLVDGTIPPGLSLTPTGTLAGTPTTDGEFSFRIEVTDDDEPPHAAQMDCQLTVYSGVYFTGNSIPPATVGIPYSSALSVSGSYPPFTFEETEPTSYEVDNAPNSFVDSGVRRDWLSDEQEWTLDFGFAFPFFGNYYSSCRVGDNGYLVFGSASPAPKWEATAENLNGCIMIAPFWTDLIITAQYPDTGIFVEQNADSITVRWRGRDFHEPQDVVNASVTLHENGRIDCRYGSIATTNRVIVGLSAGDRVNNNIVYSHTWDSNNPEYVTGWSFHDDLAFVIPQALPEWLTLTTEGTLTGTPQIAGDWSFAVTVTDQQQNSATKEFTVSAHLNLAADLDGNGDIDNDEILAYIEQWAQGEVNREDVLSAIAVWRNPSQRLGREQSAPDDLRQLPPPKPRTGEILVLQLETNGTEEDLQALLMGGYDVAEVEGNVLTVYATKAELDALRAAGYEPDIVSRQFVAPEQVSTRAGVLPEAYHDYAETTALLDQYATMYPNICRLQSLGTSVLGRDIWALKITDNPDAEENEPEVKLVSTIHGDEPLGTEMCLLLVEELLANYGQVTTKGVRVTALVDETEIWIVPIMNPDGLEAGTRYNANGLDLNRGFPDGALTNIGNVFLDQLPESDDLQPEVQAIMNWSMNHRFSLSAGLHTGALVVAYPYGNNKEGISIYTPTPDDELFQHLARTYAIQNADMWNSSIFADGIVNAADWYIAVGEMADWNYRYLGDCELTIELSDTKTPAAELIPDFWEANREALVALLETSMLGVHGTVTDADTGSPLPAQVRVEGNAQPFFTDPEAGDYHRPLMPWSYGLEFCAPRYAIKQVDDGVISDRGTRELNIALHRALHAGYRSFKLPRFEPGEESEITITIDVAEEQLPNAFIVSETLPDGWSVAPGSSRLADGATLAEPRRDGQVYSWLFWDEQVQDLTFSYQVEVPEGTEQKVYLEGVLESFNEASLVLGQNKWQALSNSEFFLQLESGWDAFSIPLTLENRSVADVFKDLDPEPEVWAWDGERMIQVQNLFPLRGYWTFLPEACIVLLEGEPVNADLPTFHEGWNFFGPGTDAPIPENEAIIGPVWKWADGYSKAGTVRMGEGYWLLWNDIGNP